MAAPKNPEQLEIVAPTTPENLAVTKAQPLNVAGLLEKVIESGVTSDNVLAIEKLVGLYERLEAKKAEQLFAEAFLALQAELPIIDGTKPIPDKQGRAKFGYANFEDIDAIVRPICLKHGFSYSFAEGGFDNGRVKVIMYLIHNKGHTKEYSYSVRPGSGPPGANESQADGSGHTYGKRGVLEAALSLRIISRPDDARMEGGPITADEAFHLERRVKETNSNVAMVLRLGGVSKFEDIPRQKYEVIDLFLQEKERKGK